jgi:hypothetical protein
MNIARLEYDAARQLLRGTIAGADPFHFIAYSGGSRGHQANVPAKTAEKYLHAETSSLSSRLATTPTRKNAAGDYVRRGGTLPPGHYTCVHRSDHPAFGECIQLVRSRDAEAIHSPFSPHLIPHGRGDDFFIHGIGPKGSDGCIIPADPAERRRLNKAVKNFQGTVILRVTRVSYMLPAELGGQYA